MLAPGLFATRAAKTAHGAIAYGEDPVVAVIDPSRAGERVRDAVPYLDSDAPIVASVADALRFDPTALLIGIAPAGGALPPAWRAEVERAIDARLEIVSGLHERLGSDDAFARRAADARVRIVDLRDTPAPRIFTGEAFDVAARVVLFVGSDCAVGKMTAALELTRAARDAGERAAFVATGQTGIAIAGSGTAIDRVISDFASGAVEELVLAARDADVAFVEGQGGIAHPAYAPVTLALLFGAAPDALVLVHAATRTHVEGFPTPIRPLRELVDLYEALCATVKPAKVVGIALNTHGLDDAEAERAIADARAATGLPCDDVVRHGPRSFYAEIAPGFARKTSAVA